MERAGIDSLNELAKKSGVAVQTIARLVHGEGATSDRVIEQVAAVLLRSDAVQVPAWAGRRWSERPRKLPDAAGQLSAKQWASVVAVINAMAYPGDQPADSGSRHLRAIEGSEKGRDETPPPSAFGKAARRRRPKSDEPDQIS